MNQGGYLLLSTVAFFLTGVGLYVADKKLTVAFRRLLHSWTSPESEPFPESKERGFVYRQRARQRFVVAGVISLVQTILSVKNLSYNPLLELMTLLIETPIMVLGTYLGERAVRLFGRAQPVFDAIDRIDAGESTAGVEARELLSDLTGRVRKKEPSGEVAEARVEPASNEDVPAEPAPAPAEAPREPDPPEADPRELMRKYTEG